MAKLPFYLQIVKTILTAHRSHNAITELLLHGQAKPPQISVNCHKTCQTSQERCEITHSAIQGKKKKQKGKIHLKKHGSIGKLENQKNFWKFLLTS